MQTVKYWPVSRFHPRQIQWQPNPPRDSLLYSGVLGIDLSATEGGSWLSVYIVGNPGSCERCNYTDLDCRAERAERGAVGRASVKNS